MKEPLKKGNAQTRVMRLLGTPVRELAPGLVEYDNCAPDQDLASGCPILLVRFEDGKVAEMNFVNRPMAEDIARASGEEWHSAVDGAASNPCHCPKIDHTK